MRACFNCDIGCTGRRTGKKIRSGEAHHNAHGPTTLGAGPEIGNMLGSGMGFGGNKACNYGWLGGGDCVDICQFNAINMGDNGLPVVVDDFCTGCGMCAEACPRHIIQIHPNTHGVFVFCRSHDGPKESKALCSVACTGCGICARKSDGAIAMDNHLAVIDYGELNPEIIPFDKCKTRAIDYLPGRSPAKQESTAEAKGKIRAKD